MHKKNSKTVVFVALGANLLIALSKFAVFFITKSSSIFSEGIHSLADTGNQILLLIGLKSAEKKADKLHPFGYGQEQFFWAFMVAVLLFSLGGLYSVFEGIDKIFHKHSIENLWIAILLLLFSIVMEGVSFLKANKEIRKIKGDLPTLSFIKKSFSVELVVVFFEDLAAILGLSIALIFILISYYTKNSVYDGVGSILIGILLIVVAMLLGSKMKSLIIGEAIPKKIKQFVIKSFLDKKGVIEIKDFKSMVLGENSMLVALEVVFNNNLNTKEIREIIDLAEREITERYPTVKNIYIEPVIRRKNG